MELDMFTIAVDGPMCSEVKCVNILSFLADIKNFLDPNDTSQSCE